MLGFQYKVQEISQMLRKWDRSQKNPVKTGSCAPEGTCPKDWSRASILSLVASADPPTHTLSPLTLITQRPPTPGSPIWFHLRCAKGSQWFPFTWILSLVCELSFGSKQCNIARCNLCPRQTASFRGRPHATSAVSTPRNPWACVQHILVTWATDSHRPGREKGRTSEGDDQG